MHQSFPIVKKTVHSGVHSHNIKHTQAQRRCSLHSYEHVYCLVTAMCACVLGVECVGGGCTQVPKVMAPGVIQA